MTRKRFIKLLMSQGRSRNESVDLAQKVPEVNESYQRVYDGLFNPPIWDSLKDFLQRMTDALVELGKAAGVAVQALSQAILEAFPVDVEEMPDIIPSNEGEEKVSIL